MGRINYDSHLVGGICDGGGTIVTPANDDDVEIEIDDYDVDLFSENEDIEIEIGADIVNFGRGLAQWQIVDELPETGKEGVVYLVPNDHESPNAYDEYVYVDSAWEVVGAIATDMVEFTDAEILEIWNTN